MPNNDTLCASAYLKAFAKYGQRFPLRPYWCRHCIHRHQSGKTLMMGMATAAVNEPDLQLGESGPLWLASGARKSPEMMKHADRARSVQTRTILVITSATNGNSCRQARKATKTAGSTQCSRSSAKPDQVRSVEDRRQGRFVEDLVVVHGEVPVQSHDVHPVHSDAAPDVRQRSPAPEKQNHLAACPVEVPERILEEIVRRGMPLVRAVHNHVPNEPHDEAAADSGAPPQMKDIEASEVHLLEA
eukprot:scaffold1866_cov277-Pinguiococcus_pyrenoidosus.AAC.6